MNSPMEPGLSLYQANVDVCREVAQILVDGTERMEKALFRNMRESVKQAFGAASHFGNAGSAESVKTPQFEEFTGAYREVLEAAIKTNSDLMHAVTQHCTKYAKLLTETSGQSLPITGMLAPPTQQLESMVKMWNQTSQQMAELAQHFAQSGAAAANEPTGRKSTRGH